MYQALETVNARRLTDPGAIYGVGELRQRAKGPVAAVGLSYSEQLSNCPNAESPLHMKSIGIASISTRIRQFSFSPHPFRTALGVQAVTKAPQCSHSRIYRCQKAAPYLA